MNLLGRFILFKKNPTKFFDFCLMFFELVDFWFANIFSTYKKALKQNNFLFKLSKCQNALDVHSRI